MKYFLIAAALLTAISAQADQTTNAVQVTCYPYSGHVEARLIDYYNCGDGHCAEEGFTESAEGQALKDAGITLILPNQKTNTFTCNIGKSVVEVEVKPDFKRTCSEYAHIKITHNNEVASKGAMLWKECEDSNNSLGVSYKVITPQQERYEVNDHMGVLIYKRQTSPNILFYSYVDVDKNIKPNYNQIQVDEQRAKENFLKK